MTAKIQGQKPTTQPGPRSAHGYQRALTLGATVYNGGITAFDPTTGMWVNPDGTNPALICTGFARLGDQDHLLGANDGNGNPLEMLVDAETALVNFPALVTANEGAIVYCSDDQTGSLTQGTRPILGLLQTVVDSTHGYVLVDPIINQALAAAASTTARKCRGVFTNSVPAYTGSKTATLTVTATGALSTEDGLTPNANEVWFWQEGSTNLTDPADAGPWLIVNPGATGVNPVLTRPTWWSHGSPIVPHSVIDIGPEGTGTDPTYAGTAWVSWAPPGKFVGTDAPSFWPRMIAGQVTLASGTLASARRTYPVRSLVGVPIVAPNVPAAASHASTVGPPRVSALTAGVTGVASIQIVAESAPGTTNTSDAGKYTLTVFNGG